MQTAHCTIDGHIYTATELSQLTEADRERLKGHLACPYCGEPAFYRRATPPGNGRRRRAAHFASRPHGPNCDITRDYSDPWESENGGDDTVAHWEQREKKLIVQIRADPTAAPNSDDTASEDDDGQRTRSEGARTRQSPNIRRGPQRLLEQLIHWPSFKTSALPIRLPDDAQTELPCHTAFVRFEAAEQDRHTATWHGFWGRVPSLTFWTLGRYYYANFGPNNSDFRIAIHENHVPEILARYRLQRIEEIVGGYLLLFDHARISTSDRFTADVNSVNHIGFIRDIPA